MMALLVVGGVAAVATVFLVMRLSRWLQSPDSFRAGSGGAADALSNFIDVFDPARARADRDLQEHHNAGPVSRTPDDEDEDPLTLLTGPDGRPHQVRVRQGSPRRRT